MYIKILALNKYSTNDCCCLWRVRHINRVGKRVGVALSACLPCSPDKLWVPRRSHRQPERSQFVPWIPNHILLFAALLWTENLIPWLTDIWTCYTGLIHPTSWPCSLCLSGAETPSLHWTAGVDEQEVPFEEIWAITPSNWVNANSPNTLPSARVPWKVLNPAAHPRCRPWPDAKLFQRLEECSAPRRCGLGPKLGVPFQGASSWGNRAWIPPHKETLLFCSPAWPMIPPH